MVDCRCRLSKEGAWALAQSGNVADKRSGGKRQKTRSSNAGQGWEDANLHSAKKEGQEEMLRPPAIYADPLFHFTALHLSLD